MRARLFFLLVLASTAGENTATARLTYTYVSESAHCDGQSAWVATSVSDDGGIGGVKLFCKDGTEVEL